MTKNKLEEKSLLKPTSIWETVKHLEEQNEILQHYIQALEEVEITGDLTTTYHHGHLGIRNTSGNFTHIILESKNSNGAMAKMNADDIKDVIKKLKELYKRMLKSQLLERL